MIRSLHIENFKAFTEPIEIQDLNGSNLVICGENGSGKTSFFEALKMIFYTYDLLEKPIVDSIVGVERERQMQELKGSFTSKKAISDFGIEINGVDYKNYDANEEAYFISYQDIKISDRFSIADYEDLFFPKDSLSIFFSIWREQSFVDSVNKKLKNNFREDIEIFLPEGEDSLIGLIDSSRGLKAYQKIDKYFSESIVHIVKLTVLFTLIEYLTSNERTKIDKVLILDDVVTSLDAANRALIIKYIIEEYKDFQKIILTHNVGFFNLCHYMVNQYDDITKWEWKNLYVNGSLVPRLFDDTLNEDVNKIDDLIDKFNSNNYEINQLGNEIRKKLEFLLLEYFKYLQFGDYHEVAYILDALTEENPHNIYLKINGDRIENVYSLVSSLWSTLNNSRENDASLKLSLQNIFKCYDKNNEMKAIIPILKDLKMFQKLLLHPISHAAASNFVVTSKEIRTVLYYMKKLEKVIIGAKKKNNTGIIYDI